MHRLKWLSLLLLLIVAGCTAGFTEVVEQEIPVAELKAHETIDIPFHAAIDEATITDEHVLLIRDDGTQVARTVTVSEDGMTLHIAPPTEGFAAGNYTLTIMPNVLTITGQPLVASDYTKKYTVPIRYRVEQFIDGQVQVVGMFNTKEEAQAAMTDNTVLFDYDTAIAIPNGQGLVITSRDGITKLYSDEALTSSKTYVGAGSELRFLEKTATAIKVLTVNEVFYIQPSNETYVPFYAERTHYTVEHGQLLMHVRHYRRHDTSTFAVADAPSFLAEGQRYYSDDGYTFYTEGGDSVGHAPPYFQFLSMRSTTSYSAQQLDDYIVNMLQQREASGGQYTNAATTSKLLGLGTVLKKVEQEMHINALFILALAQHESDYGMSNHAQTYNNLFGLYVFDSNPANKQFASIEANVYELAAQFLNKNYIPPTAGYAHGAYFGNKGQGVNVRYASDQFWGVKAAGHAYRIDRALGGQDIHRFDVLQVNDEIFNAQNRLPVYAAPQKGAELLYTIPTAHKQFVSAYREQPDAGWIAIVSDSGKYDKGYIEAKFITAK